MIAASVFVDSIKVTDLCVVDGKKRLSVVSRLMKASEFGAVSNLRKVYAELGIEVF